MNRFVTFKPWRVADVAICLFAVAVVLILGPATGLISRQGAVAGALGGLLLRHFALHGWTLLDGSFLQRMVLLCLWLVTIVLGGLVAAVLGF